MVVFLEYMVLVIGEEEYFEGYRSYRNLCCFFYNQLAGITFLKAPQTKSLNFMIFNNLMSDT